MTFDHELLEAFSISTINRLHMRIRWRILQFFHIYAFPTVGQVDPSLGPESGAAGAETRNRELGGVSGTLTSFSSCHMRWPNPCRSFAKMTEVHIGPCPDFFEINPLFQGGIRS